jgi:hypothetical protein
LSQRYRRLLYFMQQHRTSIITVHNCLGGWNFPIFPSPRRQPRWLAHDMVALKVVFLQNETKDECIC